MKSIYKIAVIGMGGVGGYIGARLASAYRHSEVQIIFLARGENASAINEKGLKLIMEDQELTAFPSKVVLDPDELEDIDLFILCTKTYQLEEAIKSIPLSKNKNAKFLPLLNGVNAAYRIKEIYPQAAIIEGCIYLVSRLTAPGRVQQFGTFNELLFGQEKGDTGELQFIEKLFRDAGINARLCDDMKRVSWEKFFFISTIATLTSYLNLSIGKILESDTNRKLLVGLMNELKQIADVKEVNLPAEIMENCFKKLQAMPYDATSSMHTDFQKGRPTELEALTGYVIELARECGMEVPYYEKMYISLTKKQNR